MLCSVQQELSELPTCIYFGGEARMEEAPGFEASINVEHISSDSELSGFLRF